MSSGAVKTLSATSLNECNGTNSEPKHYNMKQFISAATEYAHTRSESSISVINRHLQLLSVTIDLSTFDPHTSVVSEFFVSVHELLSNLEPRSPLAWCCVNVLTIACRNPAARSALIHTYQFIPPLSRLLGDQLTSDKKIRLLSLMQELTCGIKISWQIPHLSHLMSTLTRWIESAEEEIVILSLGVLVNLCYKNLPAIYTLSRCVDMKKFVRTCVVLKGHKIEVHVAKLLIILEFMEGNVPEATFMKLVETTFRSIGEAIKEKNTIMLHHVVSFFLDVKEQSEKSEYIANYQGYDVEIQKLLDTVNDFANENGSSGDSKAYPEPECMSLLFEFIHSLIELKLPKLEPLYPQIINAAFAWIQTELVCSQALAILRTIAINTTCKDSSILEPLLNGLPIFLVALNHQNEDMPTSTEYNKRLASLMQLLKAMILADPIKKKVLQELKPDLVKNVFVPLVGDSSPRLRASDADTFSPEAINMYVHALSLVDHLAKADVEWVQMYDGLLQQKQIHMILAQALYNGSKDLKTLILKMAASQWFPSDHIANAMNEVQHIAHSEPPNQNQAQMSYMLFPMASVSQIQRLDELIGKLKDIPQNCSNIATSDVMELYEYKLASMGHAERAATVSMEAASQRCTHLQHRNAQLMAELSRIHQLHFHTQQTHEDAVKRINNLEGRCKDLTNKVEAESGRRKVASSQLTIKEKLLTEKLDELEKLESKHKVLENDKQKLDGQVTKLQDVVKKLEEHLNKQEKIIKRKDELLTKANAQIDVKKAELKDVEEQFKNKESELSMVKERLQEVERDLETRMQILDSITKLTKLK